MRFCDNQVQKQVAAPCNGKASLPPRSTQNAFPAVGNAEFEGPCSRLSYSVGTRSTVLIFKTSLFGTVFDLKRVRQKFSEREKTDYSLQSKTYRKH